MDKKCNFLVCYEIIFSGGKIAGNMDFPSDTTRLSLADIRILKETLLKHSDVKDLQNRIGSIMTVDNIVIYNIMRLQ